MASVGEPAPHIHLDDVSGVGTPKGDDLEADEAEDSEAVKGQRDTFDSTVDADLQDKAESMDAFDFMAHIIEKATGAPDPKDPNKRIGKTVAIGGVGTHLHVTVLSHRITELKSFTRTNPKTGTESTFYSAIVERKIEVPVYDKDGNILKDPLHPDKDQKRTITIRQEIFTNIRVPAHCDNKTLESLENKALATVRLHETALTRAVTDHKIVSVFKENEGVISCNFTRADTSKGLYGKRSFTRASGNAGSIITAHFTRANKNDLTRTQRFLNAFKNIVMDDYTNVDLQGKDWEDEKKKIKFTRPPKITHIKELEDKFKTQPKLTLKAISEEKNDVNVQALLDSLLTNACDDFDDLDLGIDHLKKAAIFPFNSSWSTEAQNALIEVISAKKELAACEKAQQAARAGANPNLKLSDDEQKNVDDLNKKLTTAKEKLSELKMTATLERLQKRCDLIEKILEKDSPARAKLRPEQITTYEKNLAMLKQLMIDHKIESRVATISKELEAELGAAAAAALKGEEYIGIVVEKIGAFAKTKSQNPIKEPAKSMLKGVSLDTSSWEPKAVAKSTPPEDRLERAKEIPGHKTTPMAASGNCLYDACLQGLPANLRPADSDALRQAVAAEAKTLLKNDQDGSFKKLINNSIATLNANLKEKFDKAKERIDDAYDKGLINSAKHTADIAEITKKYIISSPSDYVERMKDNEFCGGKAELHVMSKLYNVAVVVTSPANEGHECGQDGKLQPYGAWKDLTPPPAAAAAAPAATIYLDRKNYDHFDLVTPEPPPPAPQPQPPP